MRESTMVVSTTEHDRIVVQSQSKIDVAAWVIGAAFLGFVTGHILTIVALTIPLGY